MSRPEPLDRADTCASCRHKTNTNYCELNKWWIKNPIATAKCRIHNRGGSN